MSRHHCNKWQWIRDGVAPHGALNINQPARIIVCNKRAAAAAVLALIRFDLPQYAHTHYTHSVAQWPGVHVCVCVCVCVRVYVCTRVGVLSLYVSLTVITPDMPSNDAAGIDCH